MSQNNMFKLVPLLLTAGLCLMASRAGASTSDCADADLTQVVRPAEILGWEEHHPIVEIHNDEDPEPGDGQDILGWEEHHPIADLPDPENTESDDEQDILGWEEHNPAAPAPELEDEDREGDGPLE